MQQAFGHGSARATGSSIGRSFCTIDQSDVDVDVVTAVAARC